MNSEEEVKNSSLPEGLAQTKEELLKKLEPDLLLHPAGGLASSFVYEPIDVSTYVYKTKDNKTGISSIITEYENPEEKKGKCSYFIIVEGEQHYFARKPASELIFNLPDRKTVEKWIHGEKKSVSTKDLWKLNGVYLRTFLDFPHQHEFNVNLLFIMQSWLTELLIVVFYLGVKGEFGGGKTVTGEAITSVCRHGYLTGNLSPPFVARAIQEQKITLMVDELDSIAGTKDSDLNSIFRQGYRRGMKYSRVNPENLQTESYAIFGPKLFTVHSEIEEALQTRTIPTHIRETGDPAYPMVGSDRLAFARQIYTENFLWYMDSILTLRDNDMHTFNESTALLDILDTLDVKIRDLMVPEHSNKIRETLFTHKKSLITEGQVSQVCQVAGRNVELMYLCFVISNTIGMDCDNDIKQAFEQKLVEEGERTEVGYIGLLKDVLVSIWTSRKDDDAYKTEDGSVKISNKELYDTFNERLKQQAGQGVSPATFKGYMLEFGFADALNRKKLEVPIPGDDSKKSRLCNIFTDRVLRKLGIDLPTPTGTTLQTPLIKEKEASTNLQTSKGSLEGLASKVLKLERLKDHFEDKCVLCGLSGRMDWQATEHDGSWALLCGDCGDKLAKRLDLNE